MALDEGTLKSVVETRARLLDLEHEADRVRVDFHHGIRRLHAAGGSLREIAQEFALSHQRVHQIVDVAAGGRKRRGTVLFEQIRDRVRDWEPFTRFTKEARAVVVRAQEEAKELGHGQIGTEHVLLGLLHAKEETAARVLKRLGVQLEPTRAEIVRAIGTGDCVRRGKSLPFTPRAKRVLEHSLREALALEDNYIGTEHILLGLLRERSGLAARLLREAGADAERVRMATKQALASD